MYAVVSMPSPMPGTSLPLRRVLLTSKTLRPTASCISSIWICACTTTVARSSVSLVFNTIEASVWLLGPSVWLRLIHSIPSTSDLAYLRFSVFNTHVWCLIATYTVTQLYRHGYEHLADSPWPSLDSTSQPAPSFVLPSCWKQPTGIRSGTTIRLSSTCPLAQTVLTAIQLGFINTFKLQFHHIPHINSSHILHQCFHIPS